MKGNMLYKNKGEAAETILMLGHMIIIELVWDPGIIGQLL
jgi:hypothetical protein